MALLLELTDYLVLPHLALITGILINAVGVVWGITGIIVHVSPLKHKLIKGYNDSAAFAALWFTTYGMCICLLPFSNGEHFRFNLDPIVARSNSVDYFTIAGVLIFCNCI